MAGDSHPLLSVGERSRVNIALRPSGGRGEYELAGTQGELHVSSLFGHPLFLETLPGVSIDMRSKCVLRDGKPRIRLDKSTRNAHPSALIASAMMLPKPIRTRSETHGSELLRWECFVVQTIRIEVIVRPDGSVLVSPLTVRLENADDARLDISFAERMARVVRVWAAAVATDAIAVAVQSHAFAFASPLATQAQMTAALPALHAAMGNPDGDMLPILETHFSINATNAPSVGAISAEIDDNDFIEDVEHVDPAEARVDRVRQWRLAAVRGGSSSAFRSQVRDAYDWRCMFSGKRLPRTEATPTAGVDAAHILPWSKYDLDDTMNGLCLSKECHWAFDAGVLRLAFDDATKDYVVSIPPAIRPAALKANFDLASFAAMTGAVPRGRLPSKQAHWPSPTYIGALNRFLDGRAA